MQLTADDLTALSLQAIMAAKAAGVLIQRYAHQSVAVEYKRAGDSIASQVVTEVDLLSEKIIIKALQPTCHEYDLALLSEESEDDKARLHKDYFWCIDPMDGTLAFTESIPGYAVSIALVARSGEALIGVVYDPVSQTLYSAVKGQGIFRNGKPWCITTEISQDKPLTLVCDRGFAEKIYYGELRKSLTSLAVENGMSGLQIVERNGAVLNACWVLEHAPACYIKCPKPQQGGGSLWDFAATSVLFNEMGASVSDIYGRPLDLNRAESLFMNHHGVLFITTPSLREEIQALLMLCSE